MLKKRNNFTLEDWEKHRNTIYTYLLRGCSLADIGLVYSTSRQRIHQVINELCLVYPSKEDIYQYNKEKTYPQYREDITYLFNANIPRCIIAAKYNITQNILNRLLSDWNLIKTKPKLDSKKQDIIYQRLLRKGLPESDALSFVQDNPLPLTCPILNIPLTYGAGLSDNAASVDRINPRLGYTLSNIHIISTRANRIKNDSTPEELIKLGLYMEKLGTQSETSTET